MGTLLKGILLILVVGIALLAYLATSGSTRQCPDVTPTAMTSGQIGDALARSGSVRISNGDATAVGMGYVGSAVAGMRVCFDTAGGHASGKLAAGPIQLPFYVTASRVDLSGSSPRVTELDFQMGSVPSEVVNAAKSTITALINDYLATIKLNKRYAYQFGDGAVTVRSE